MPLYSDCDRSAPQRVESRVFSTLCQRIICLRVLRRVQYESTWTMSDMETQNKTTSGHYFVSGLRQYCLLSKFILLNWEVGISTLCTIEIMVLLFSVSAAVVSSFMKIKKKTDTAYPCVPFTLNFHRKTDCQPSDIPCSFG